MLATKEVNETRAEADKPTESSDKVSRFLGICVDGFPFIAVALILAGLLYSWGGFWPSMPFIVLAAFVTYFFRDPNRIIPNDEGVVVSPADGKVVDVQSVDYPRLLEGRAIRISIFLSVFNVHINRIPIGGVIEEVFYNPGKFLAAYNHKASLDNEQTAVLVKTKKGVPIIFVQIAGAVARRIICRLSKDENVRRGQRYGLIRFGSRADVYFPESAQINVRVGDRVKGGESILGRI